MVFSPLLNLSFVENFSDSLNLYFQKFEFNAGVYYVLRWIGFQYKGYNLIQVIGPLLALCTFLGIVALAFKEKHVKSFLFVEPSHLNLSRVALILLPVVLLSVG